MAWISWLNVALGLWLACAGFSFQHARGAGVPEDVIAGLIVALGALWAARAFRPTMSRFASFVVVLSGLWIVTAPFVLHYRRGAALYDDVIVGLAIVILATANMRAKSHPIAPTSQG